MTTFPPTAFPRPLRRSALLDMLAAYWCQEFGSELRGDTAPEGPGRARGVRASIRAARLAPLTGPSRCDPPAERGANQLMLEEVAFAPGATTARPWASLGLASSLHAEATPAP